MRRPALPVFFFSRFRLRLRTKIALVLGTALALAGAVSGARRLSPTYDVLVGLDEHVAKEWSGVEAQLQRRYDLVPNLVEVAKGAAAHEHAVFVQIAEARAGFAGARSRDERIDAAQRVEVALRRVPVVVNEAYPKLAANGRFRDLMRSLERTEDGILAQRLKYNQAVADYNAKQRSIEGRLVSAFTRFRPASYYHAPEASQERVVVSLSPSAAPETKPAPTAAPPSPHATNLVAFADVVPASADAPAPAQPPLTARFKVNGIMTSGSTREAVVVGPDGRSVVVRKGSVLPSSHARVVAIDDRGVVVEDRGPDGKGDATEVRLP